MPYTPNPDDAAAPLNTEFASSAALEFRTLKAKLNQLFLSSAINSSENSINSTKAFVVDNTGGSGSELWMGVRGAASRTGGTGSVLAGFFSAALADSVTQASGGAVRGTLVEAFTGSVDSVCGTPGLSGVTSVVVQRNHSGQDVTAGMIVKFQDRTDALDAGAVVGGIGDDLYNKNAIGLLFQSQARSTEGERCGWTRGIVFDSNAIDEDANTISHPSAIDFNGLAAYDSVLMPVPFNLNASAIEVVATTNGGATTPPTTLLGFLRFTVAGVGTFGIPVCSLAALP
jgi:hypothetical protein